MNLHNISVISRYETRLLRRSWLFRIFAVLSLLTIVGCHLMLQSNMLSYQWGLTGLSSSIPFMNVYIFNIAQSIIAIFLAGNFLKRDKKLDTAEVIYVHPMSNADYIVGKTWGIIRVFVSLNIIALVIALLVHVFASESPFALYPYFFYLFTLAIPSLIFILGISFIVMSFVRNQAVTFVIMLGFVGVTLFYLSESVHGAFDAFALAVPNVFSDVTGHADLEPYLMQRLTFLFLGIGALLFTIVMVQRIPLHPKKNSWLCCAGVIVLLIGGGFMYLYLSHFQIINHERQLFAEKYRAYESYDKVRLVSQNLVYSQADKRMDVRAELEIENDSPVALDEFIFYLNPALEVTRLTCNGENVSFRKDEQVVVVERALRPGEKVFVEMEYGGGINENICYLDVEDEEYYNTQTGSSVLRFGKRYAFLDKTYTLLTPEVLWYPVTQPPVNIDAPYNLRKNFSRYSLKVLKPEGKTVLSQGKERQRGDTVVFTNENLLPGISLAIGNYEKKAIMVDSVEFAAYMFEGHDNFSDVFTELQDTLVGFVRDVKNEYEMRKGRKYPFGKLALTETPISFAGYVRNWKGNSEQVQPEFVFLPERLVSLGEDFKQSKKRYTEWAERDSRQSSEPVDIETRVINDFIRWRLQSETIYEAEGNILINMFTDEWTGGSKLNKSVF